MLNFEEPGGGLSETDESSNAAPGGVPIFRALDVAAVAAAMAARLRPNLRSAILVLEDEGLLIAAERNLRAADRLALRKLADSQSVSALHDFAHQPGVTVRALVTEAAELIGWIILFSDLEVDVRELEKQLDEVCWIATLALEQTHLLEDLAYRAHHDPLTRLWNRLRMEEEIDRVWAELSGSGQVVGLVLIGIDSFRIINDVLGCHAGNELLQQIAQRLIPTLDASVSLARVGGDEFMVLLPGLNFPEQVAAANAALLQVFQESFHIGDHELVVRASVGSATGRPGECSAAELQNHANIAFRYAKKRERGRAANFHSSMASIPPERLVMEQHLRFALQKREFEVYYQPQIDLLSGELVGAEALLRWRHPWLGFISPGTFIPIAEEIGLIEEIGDWAIDEALRFASNWKRSAFGKIRIAVNVSGLQFSRADFGSSVARKLRRVDIAPEDLELEITESVVMTNFEHGLRQLNILRSLGVQLAVDDFGTGHSSLAYLQQLPIHRLKVDRMFVKNIVSRNERPPLLASIVQMAHALDLSVIVEGVETQEQAFAVAAMKCEEMQGFLVSKPLAGEDFRRWAQEKAQKKAVWMRQTEECAVVIH